MERIKLIEKLSQKADISSEDAKQALEESNWDMLDAMLYLEEWGKVTKPSVSIFYTNKYRYNEEKREIINIETTKYGRNNNFEGIFERVCKLIDTCNNIFLVIKRKDKVLFNVPLTAVIILLFFTFWGIIPLIIISLFLDIEFYISSMRVNTDKVNRVLKSISDKAKSLKEKLKRGSKIG